MKTYRSFCLKLCLLVFAWLPMTVNAAAVSPSYQLGAGDRVKVTVFGQADLSGTFEISAQGILSLPLIRSLKVAGLTQGELEVAVTNRLRPDYLVNPRVSVEVLSYRPFYIVGEVKSPGDFPYQANLTVMKAIAIAGGYDVRANQKKVYITRAKDEEQKKKVASMRTRVLPGDIITIPERFF